MSTIESLNTWKQLGSVRLVATSNQAGTYYNGPTNNGVGATFTYATGALTIDSVSVSVNDYILFAGQTSAYQNGIYQCIQAGATGVAAILQRRGDFQCIEQIRGGQYIPVSAGTANAGSIWVVVEPLPSGIGVPTVSGANNINFSNAALEGDGVYLQVANNLSDVNNAATALSNLGGVTLAGGQLTGSLYAAKATGTVSGGAVTINKQAGVITTTSLSTAGGSSTAITLTNSQISTSSVLLVSWMGGTNTTANFSMSAVPGAGSATITIYNNTASTALNGTIIIGFEVL